MIHFERGFDPALIRAIATHPQVWRHISDDHSPAVDDYLPPDPRHVLYVMVRDIYPDSGPEELLGFYLFHPLNSICWEVHTCLLPAAWGPRAQQAGCLITEWIFEHTPCRRIVTNVPVYNRVALAYAKRAGLVEYGRNPASFLKDGKLHDQILLGISPRWGTVDIKTSEKEAVCH